MVFVLYSNAVFAPHQGCSNKFSISSRVLPFVSGSHRNIQKAPLVVTPAYSKKVPEKDENRHNPLYNNGFSPNTD